MEKHLLELWLRLFQLKTYHSRTNDDEPTQWVQWSDIEQVVYDFILEHKLKTVGHVLHRRHKFMDTFPSKEVDDLKGTVAQLRQRLQDRDEQAWNYMNPADMDIIA